MRVGGHFVAAHPQRAQNAVVQWHIRVVFQRGTGKAGAHKMRAAVGAGPLRDFYQVVYADGPGGFFAGFAHRRIHQGFPGIQVTGGLVEYFLAMNVLFDHQEFSVPFHHGGPGIITEQLAGPGEAALALLIRVNFSLPALMNIRTVRVTRVPVFGRAIPYETRARDYPGLSCQTATGRRPGQGRK